LVAAEAAAFVCSQLKPTDILIYDLETKETFQQVGSRDPRALHISVLGMYSTNERKLICYEEHELGEFWRRLEDGAMVVGFNNKGFDDIVCQAYFPEMSKVPSFDLLEAFHKAAGFRVRLDNLAQATLGRGKTSHGLEAIKMWNEGRIEELKDYCLSDVAITRELFEHGKNSGWVKYSDIKGDKQIFIDFNPQEEGQDLNLSLF